ncbi:hypothetical protein HBI56_007690 [Parastagonospora nodorum]|nr:hypothetical protein HBH56_122030 [Parastagonospora nodorum]KAH3934911.1 hypothetical protein HBH54_047580 [Parastagonospora nodorum]KAH3949988.1 hypothetical protein HBH53_076390 [Parastagonospora nodorum]KAH3986936.1 hypothetical protein HBH51_009480 [Parastagonospora nodorum]KAH3987562.1 hypothetical protein HBH52_037950 [Parastagonospora nodorum]
MGRGALDNTDASQPSSSAAASAIDAHHAEQARPFTPTKKNAEDLVIDDQGFIRKNDEISRCVTGQYTIHLSRKVISDYFSCMFSCSTDTSNLMRNKQAP